MSAAEIYERFKANTATPSGLSEKDLELHIRLAVVETLRLTGRL